MFCWKLYTKNEKLLIVSSCTTCKVENNVQFGEDNKTVDIEVYRIK